MRNKAQIMDLLTDAICVVDRNGVFLSVSGACERIFGYPENELIGRQMLQLVHEPDRERTLRAVGRLMEGHLQYNFQNRYVRKNGGLVDIMWSARWHPDKGVRIAIAQEITERAVGPSKTGTDPWASPLQAKYWRLSGAPPSLTPPGARPIALSAQDYLVLKTLASGGQVVSRKKIVAALGHNYLEYDQRRMDSQIRRLRRKVEQSCNMELPVATIRGVGYRFYDPIETLPF